MDGTKNRTASHYAAIICIFGGTAWESNPADLARRSQAVLKTVEGTSTPISPVKTLFIIRANVAAFKTNASFLVEKVDKDYNRDMKLCV